VLAIGIRPRDLVQYNFFETDLDERLATEQKLMRTIDGINHKVGADVIKYAVEGIQRGWWMNQDS